MYAILTIEPKKPKGSPAARKLEQGETMVIKMRRRYLFFFVVEAEVAVTFSTAGEGE